MIIILKVYYHIIVPDEVSGHRAVEELGAVLGGDGDVERVQLGILLLLLLQLSGILLLLQHPPATTMFVIQSSSNMSF